MIRNMAFAIVLGSLPFAGFGQATKSWECVGGNAQHSGVYVGTSQPARRVQWQASLDDNRSYYGGSVLAHFASPMISSANTVVYAYRFTKNGGSGSSPYDNWRMIGRNGSDGSMTWSFDTDYSSPQIYPNGWTTTYPTTLCQVTGGTGVAAAGAAGSVWVRSSADATTSATNRFAFYTTQADFNANKASYSVIKINTPLTSDKQGNLYFGYEVTGTLPSGKASLGTGGIAKVNATTGVSTFKSVQALGISGSLSRPARSAGPALSVDEKSVYVALTGGVGMLAKLDANSLAATASVRLTDPSIPGANASLINESSACPMVAPDGHVFMGVFGNQWRQSHGWMLQFDGNLNPNNSSGKRFPAGAFGWDDTPSVVPSSAVPSYKGTSPYLILTKYNNYDMGGDPGADGQNMLAVLDPSSDSITKDRQSGIAVMNEILTVVAPNRTNDDPAKPDARHEWCINAAAVDVNGKSAIVNCEDGHMYRWSFVTNKLVEDLNLQPPTGEAYTSTAIGPDGKLYAMNNCILFAIGTPGASDISMYQGKSSSGSLSDIWYLDSKYFSVMSMLSTAGQVAAIEVGYIIGTDKTNLAITADVLGVNGGTAQMYAFNFVTSQYVLVSTKAFTAGSTRLSATLKNSPQYFDAYGRVKVLVRGVTPGRLAPAPFTLNLDYLNVVGS